MDFNIDDIDLIGNDNEIFFSHATWMLSKEEDTSRPHDDIYRCLKSQPPADVR